LITANPDYRPNSKRAIYVQGRIDQQLIDRLTPEIVRLQSESREPITVYIDSPGGSTVSADSLSRLLEATDQNSSGSCRIITVVTGLAASAAADLLCSGDYAIAYAGCTIFFHGIRRASGDPITVAAASSMAESLRLSNDRYAIALADKSLRRLGFRYLWTRHEFDDYRLRTGKGHTDVECFVGLLSERLSGSAVKVVNRAVQRNKRYEALIDRVGRAAQRRARFKNPKRTAETEAVVIKSIIDFEMFRNKQADWTFSDRGLRQVNDDFLLVREYLNIYDGDHLTRLCDNWGNFFLDKVQSDELSAIKDDSERRQKKHELAKPLLRPLWLFFVALCYALQEEENELTALDAFWLGLIDEVIGGPPGLFPFRLIIEDVPDPPATTPPDPA
jgi:ATP-dependent protease ClpP protease subunit